MLCDKCVKADVIVNMDNLIELFGKFRNENVLIDMYVQKLLDDKQWYEEHSKYWDKADEKEPESIWNTN